MNCTRIHGWVVYQKSDTRLSVAYADDESEECSPALNARSGMRDMERAVGDACLMWGGEPGSRERAYQRSATRQPIVTFALAGALALVGCERRERLQRDAPLITAAPDAVDAGAVWVGFPREFSLTYRNDGKPSQTLRISSSDPRAIPSSAELTVPGAESVTLTVTLRSNEPGSIDSARIAAAFDDNVVVTRVSAEFLSLPDCHSTRECLEGAFNADAGVCEWRTVADGEPCASLCVANGSCVEGQCAGEAVSCPAPSSTCQGAVCSPTLGCIEVPRVCEPSSSCVSATCIEGQGCVEMVREDGHYCGEPECDQDHVCLDGACRAATPPLGVQVTPCLRAKQVLVTDEGMGCAVTMDAGAICWGSVSAQFADSLGLSPYVKQTSGARFASLAEVDSLLTQGLPLCMSRVDGGVYCKVAYESDDSWLKYWRSADAGMVRLRGLDGALEVMAFQDSLCGRFANGEVRCAGADRPFPGRSVTVQYQLDGGSVVSGMAASLSAAANGMENWTCVRMQDGTVQCRDALVGLVDENCRTGMATDAFRPFGGFPQATSLTTGPQHACVTASGLVWCRGKNDGYALGARTRTADCLPPGPVPGISNAAKIIDDSASCALLQNGQVWCWGSDFRSQNESAVDRWPKRVAGLDHVIDADFGRTPRDGRGTLCAVRNDGLVKCLGGNRYGQAGMFNADGGPAPDYLVTPRAIPLHGPVKPTTFIE